VYPIYGEIFLLATHIHTDRERERERERKGEGKEEMLFNGI
jgi:hypothetical protein